MVRARGRASRKAGGGKVTKKYVYRDGWRGPSSLAPDLVAKELARIRRSHGALTSEAVVAAASPEAAPLHPAFEWDDSVAGLEYRLIQARKLIRAVQIVKDDEKPMTVYAFVPGEERTGEYEPTEGLALHVDRWTLALAEALRYLRSAEDRVGELKRVAGDQPGRVAMITIAAQALTTAEQAIKSLGQEQAA